jgi:hypothetical protein
MPSAFKMCFPSKKTKDNFTEAPKTTKAATTPPKTPEAKKDTAAPVSTAATTTPAAATTTPAAKETATPAAPAPQITTTIPDATLEAKSQPKIGIIIYSLYGHVATRE